MRQGKFVDHTFSALSIGLAALLVFSAALLWVPSVSVGDNSRNTDAAAPDDPFARFETDIASNAQPVADRPVFQASRRPPVVEVAEEAPAPEVTLTLVGVLDSEISKIALFRMSNRPEILRLREGQVISDFRILTIEDVGVTLLNEDGAEVVMKLGN